MKEGTAVAGRRDVEERSHTCREELRRGLLIYTPLAICAFTTATDVREELGGDCIEWTAGDDPPTPRLPKNKRNKQIAQLANKRV